MKSAKLWMFVAVLMMGIVPAFAQTNVNEEQGMKPYDSWHGGDLDSISMTNRGLVLHIPLVSFPQRGNLDLSFFITQGRRRDSGDCEFSHRQIEYRRNPDAPAPHHQGVPVWRLQHSDVRARRDAARRGDDEEIERPDSIHISGGRKWRPGCDFFR